MPEDIMYDFMDFSDIEAITRFLSTYQKTRPDWDNFRHKIPDTLLEKFSKVLRECRKHGFINPKTENEKIVWKQILGFQRNVKSVDQCTTCSRSFTAGECKGRAIIKNMQRMFNPCWSEL